MKYAAHAFILGSTLIVPLRSHAETKGPPAFAKTAQTADQLIPRIIVEGTTVFPIVDLAALRKHETPANPSRPDFDYAKAFAKLDLEQVKADLKAIFTDSKGFWPADYGHYGPLFIRLSWHSAGTYRALDGRGGADGGQMRFYPLASWPDNANLDKARLLLQPVVDKYYPNLSWADAMVLVGNLAMEDMGFKTLGFAGGRVDDWAPDMVYWGPEDAFLKSERFDKDGNLMMPLAASVLGLIYVNPEGPDGKPDPLLSAGRIRTTFGRMGMNDEETVALIAGGHTFGKAHGAPRPEACKDPKENCPAAKGAQANTSGLEGSWTARPIEWTHEYLKNLFGYEWKLTKGPGGKYQWYAENLSKDDFAPDAHDPAKKVPLMMLTTDLALRYDPAYKVIAERFLNNPEEFGTAFARAWFKLIHRDLGPKSRYLGNDYTKEDFIWQDPLPAQKTEIIDASDIDRLKGLIRSSGLSVADRVKTAWGAAASFRGTDMKGGINGARIRLEPQRSWEVNEPERLGQNLAALEKIQADFNAGKSRRKVSLADLIVLAGNTAVEDAARAAGFEIAVPFTAGRVDASQEQTDPMSFNMMKVTADGFRNYYNPKESYLPADKAFVDRADVLNLTRNELVVLTGGLRVLGANYKGVSAGELTTQRGTLTNDYFINLLDKQTKWVETETKGLFDGVDRQSGAKKWTASAQDLMLGTTEELRIFAFSYANANAKRKFIGDFVEAWTKVMSLDRFDLKKTM